MDNTNRRGRHSTATLPSQPAYFCINDDDELLLGPSQCIAVDIFNLIRKGQQRCGLWLPVLYVATCSHLVHAAVTRLAPDITGRNPVTFSYRAKLSLPRLHIKSPSATVAVTEDRMSQEAGTRKLVSRSQR